MRFASAVSQEETQVNASNELVRFSVAQKAKILKRLGMFSTADRRENKHIERTVDALATWHISLSLIAAGSPSLER